jgi:NAD(P)-dependent dehydrogenase (short-subunit alcohol dehydrogenase family)
MQVNFFALVRMCKAFAPLLEGVPGSRIINLTSTAGLVSIGPAGLRSVLARHAPTGGNPLPYLTEAAGRALAVPTRRVSAAESFSSTLRLELTGKGVKVITVNPST